MTKDSWLKEGEEVVSSGFAKRLSLWGSSDGQLVLTTDRLLFTDCGRMQVRWQCDLLTVRHVGPASNASVWTAFLIVTFLRRNAIGVVLREGKACRFVVNDRQRWLALVGEAKDAAQKEWTIPKFTRPIKGRPDQR
jgi:hypothetical protein